MTALHWTRVNPFPWSFSVSLFIFSKSLRGTWCRSSWMTPFPWELYQPPPGPPWCCQTKTKQNWKTKINQPSPDCWRPYNGHRPSAEDCCQRWFSHPADGWVERMAHSCSSVSVPISFIVCATVSLLSGMDFSTCVGLCSIMVEMTQMAESTNFSAIVNGCPNLAISREI